MKTCLGVFITIFLFITVSLALLGIEIKASTSSEFLTKNLSQSGIYKALPQVANESLKDVKDSSGNPGVEVIKIAAQPPYLETQINQNLPKFLSFLNGKTSTAGIIVDLKPFQAVANLNSLKGLSDLSDEAAKLPSCPANTPTEQASQLNCIPSTGTANLKSIDTFIKDVESGVFKTSDLPNADQSFANAQKSVQKFNLVLIALIILSVIFVGLLLIIGLKPWQSGFRWAGWGLFVPVFINFLVFLVSKLALPSISEMIISRFDSNIVNLLKPSLIFIAGKIINIGLFYSGIILGFSIILIILSYVIPQKRDSNVQPVK